MTLVGPVSVVMKIQIRDLLYIITIIGILMGWYLDHQRNHVTDYEREVIKGLRIHQERVDKQRV